MLTLEQDPTDSGDSQLTRLNDAILKELGSSWQDWRLLDPGRVASLSAGPWAEEASKLVHGEFADATVCVLNDPRLCRLVPFWLGMLASKDVKPLAILPVRHPLEVARSLQVQDGLTLDRGLLLWLRHVLDAEASSRRVPRSIIVLPRFLAGWRGEARRVAADLGIEWPHGIEDLGPDVDTFVTQELQRQRAGDEEALGHTRIHDWALTIYEAMTRLSEEPLSNSACVEIDRVRTQFESACRLFSPLAYERVAELEAAAAGAAAASAANEAERAGLKRDRARLTDMALAAKVERDAGSRLIAAKEGELATFREALATASGDMTQMVGGVAALTGIIGRQDDETSRLKAELDGAHEAAAREIEALQVGKGAAEAEARRLAADLAAMQAAARDAAAQHAEEAAQAQALLAAAQEAAARETGALQADKGAAEAEVQGLAALLHQCIPYQF